VRSWFSLGSRVIILGRYAQHNHQAECPEITMRVADLMQTELQTIPADAKVSDAATTLADARVSALPVVDDRGRLVGVISSTDILALEEEAEGDREKVLDRTAVRDVMTPEPLTISPDAEIREGARRLLEADVHRLIVMESGRMVGIFSTTDIIRAVAAGQL
jgi:CBS-domain-containing membrane protein